MGTANQASVCSRLARTLPHMTMSSPHTPTMGPSSQFFVRATLIRQDGPDRLGGACPTLTHGNKGVLCHS
jgi:hypothetical protein